MTVENTRAAAELMARIREAAQRGAMEGYRKVLEEHRNKGPAR